MPPNVFLFNRHAKARIRPISGNNGSIVKAVISWGLAFAIVFGAFHLLGRYGLPKGFQQQAPLEANQTVPGGPKADDVPERMVDKLRKEQPDRKRITIYECDVRGQRMYSEQPCPTTVAVAPQPQLQMQTQPQVRSPVAEADPPPRTRTYVEQYENFKRNQTQERVQVADTSRAQAEAEKERSRAICRGFYDELKNIDNMARMPHSAQMQDQLRIRRKQVTDRIFEMRCESQ